MARVTIIRGFRTAEAERPCTCGHPALVHRWDDAHACMTEACTCTGFTSAKKKSKMHNRPVRVNGHRFASQAEAERAGELEKLLRVGEIEDLIYQPRYRIESFSGDLICVYVGDFEYLDAKTRKVITEDVKGFRTPEYRLKRKMMRLLNGIEIVEIPA